MDAHETYLVRLWLPDRPGALGAVTSRFGALKGDVIGLEIVERGGGLAIDELGVSLPADVSVDLILREVGMEEEVEIEDVRLLSGSIYDPHLDVLEAASILMEAESCDQLTAALPEHVCRAVRSSWACVVGPGGGVIGSWGDRPNDRWLDSFISGSPAVKPGVEWADQGPAMDTVWLSLPAASAALVVGRDSVIRTRERQRLAALAKIADRWFGRLRERADRQALAFHPAGTGD
ncbi:MAG: hypothetical protein ACR2QK_08780 [Acidimicrobiales bacterium]